MILLIFYTASNVLEPGAVSTRKESTVNIRVLIHTSVVVFFVAVILCGETSAEESRESVKPQFVDLDGDGLNDNVPDLNNDGIPDFDKAGMQQEYAELEPAESNIFRGIQPAKGVTQQLFLSNAERFRSLKFCARSLLQCRGGFSSGEDFGPGNGIGQGALSGNCVGGICRF
jgi:hypothetical protein